MKTISGVTLNKLAGALLIEKIGYIENKVVAKANKARANTNSFLKIIPFKTIFSFVKDIVYVSLNQ